MITLDTRVVAGSDQVSVDLNSEAVILNTKSGIYFGLDEVGQRIWQIVQTSVTVKTIHNALVNEFDVAPGRCADDLIGFLTDLSAEGLVRVETGE